MLASVAKEPFPYRTATGGLMIPLTGPFSVFFSRMDDVHSLAFDYESMWTKVVTAQAGGNPDPPIQAANVSELSPALLSSALLGLTVAFETFLEDYEEALKQAAGHFVVPWPGHTHIF